MATNNLPSAPIREKTFVSGLLSSSWANWFGQLYSKIGGVGADSFSPTLITDATSGTVTYSTQLGRWSKIGNIVLMEIQIVITNWTGSPTGNVLIGNLPFSFINNSGGGTIGKFSKINLGAGYSQLGLVGVQSQNYAQLWASGSGLAVSAAQITAANVATTASITANIISGV